MDEAQSRYERFGKMQNFVHILEVELDSSGI
jgi:hypothetical protein